MTRAVVVAAGDGGGAHKQGRGRLVTGSENVGVLGGRQREAVVCMMHRVKDRMPRRATERYFGKEAPNVHGATYVAGAVLPHQEVQLECDLLQMILLQSSYLCTVYL